MSGHDRCVEGHVKDFDSQTRTTRSIIVAILNGWTQMQLARENHAAQIRHDNRGQAMKIQAGLQRFRRVSMVCTVVLLVATASFSQASTVMQVGVTDLLQHSRLVVHGHVTEMWTSYDARRDTVFTNVRIDVEEVVKGQLQDDHVVIQYEGGSHGNMTVSIGGTLMPIPGEEGIYFIEDPDNVQVNPLYGWNQGHYVVRYSDDGQQKLIMTSDLRPVFGIAPVSLKNSVAFSKGVPAGVDVDASPAREPMTVGEFTSTLQQMLEAGQ